MSGVVGTEPVRMDLLPTYTQGWKNFWQYAKCILPITPIDQVQWFYAKRKIMGWFYAEWFYEK